MNENLGKSNCEGCDGAGIRVPAQPSCLLPQRDSSWIIVEKCDYCGIFDSDLAAAAKLFKFVKWVQCASGGMHALGKGPSQYAACGKSRLHARYI